MQAWLLCERYFFILNLPIIIRRIFVFILSMLLSEFPCVLTVCHSLASVGLWLGHLNIDKCKHIEAYAVHNDILPLYGFSDKIENMCPIICRFCASGGIPVCKMPPFVLPFVVFRILICHLLPCVIPYIMSEFWGKMPLF